MTAAEDEELLDLVDTNDQVVGTILRRDTGKSGTMPKGRYIRGASCFIMNSKQQLWIPRRTLHKKIAPGGLDYSVGGHVTSGETYEEALVHEFAEEVNIHIATSELIFIGKETPALIPSHYYFSKVYIYLSDKTPQYNPDDFTGYEWLTASELRAKLLAGEPAKESLLLATDFVLAYLGQDQRN